MDLGFNSRDEKSRLVAVKKKTISTEGCQGVSRALPLRLERTNGIGGIALFPVFTLKQYVSQFEATLDLQSGAAPRDAISLNLRLFRSLLKWKIYDPYKQGLGPFACITFTRPIPQVHLLRGRTHFSSNAFSKIMGSTFTGVKPSRNKAI